MLKDLHTLYATLILEGAHIEARDLLRLIKEAEGVKMLHDYESNLDMGRSGEGRMSMSDENRELTNQYILAILKDSGKNLDNITGYDIHPDGFSGILIGSYPTHLLRSMPTVKAVFESHNANWQNKYGMLTKAISFISMDILKKIYIKKADTKYSDAQSQLEERGFSYKSTGSIRFLTLAPDYENVYAAERDYEESDEEFMIAFARKLISTGNYKDVTAQVIIDEYISAYPEQPINPATAIRVALYLKREASSDWGPIITEIVMDYLVRGFGDGKITADKIMALFYEKYPSAPKKRKTFFNTFLSDLKKHFKYYIRDVIMELSEEGLSDVQITRYLSVALNYSFTQSNVALIRRKVQAGTPVVKKAPTNELSPDINFEERRVREHTDAKIDMLRESVESLLEASRSANIGTHPRGMIEGKYIAFIEGYVDRLVLEPEMVKSIIDDAKQELSGIMDERYKI
jgi:hypothetical protein